MTAQITKLFNAFETTLTSTVGASGLDFVVNSVTAPTAVTLTAPFYIVLNPDSSTNREVILVTSVNTGTKTLTCDNINKRFLDGSAASSGLSHASGSVVRMSPVEQHIEDLNDRIDTIINEDGTQVKTTLFLDEDDMATNSATKGVTQQSVKAYVDAQVTAQDLDLISDSGTIDIDLDSESLTVAGGEGIDTSATGTTLTIAGEDASTSNKGVASFSSDNFSVSSGDVTIKAGGVDLTAEVTGTLPVANGGTGATAFDDKAVIITQDTGTDTLAAAVMDANGELLIGGTSGPAVATLTAGSNVTITNSDGGISIAATDTNTTYTAGDGLDLSGTEFSTDLKTNGGLVIETNKLAVDLGATSITGELAVGDGGTGQTSYTDGQLLIGNTTGNTLAKGTLTAGSNVSITNGSGSITIAATDTNTTYTAGTLLDLATTTFNVDLAEATEAAIVDGDYVMFLDGGASGTAAKEAIGDIATLFAGTGLTASSSVIGVDTSQNITALTGGDLTIYEDANNADVSVKMGTSAAESLTIEVLNGGSNKTAEQINFTTATASSTANHGKMVFNVDETEIATIDDDGINLAASKTFRVNGTEVGGSANALVVDNSDFTLTDTGTATGIHYELDNVDTADWNQGGIALTTAGGIFTHHQTQASTYTVAANTGSVLAGPITITGTVTNNGTMVVV